VRRRGLILTALLAGAFASAAQLPPPAQERLGREVLRELIEIDTTNTHGDTTSAAVAMAARFRAAGFPEADVQVIGAAPRKGNLIVRYRGRGGSRRPVLFLAHLDVVEALRDDWSLDPFVLSERDGYFYGRGTIDVKGGAANLVCAFLRLREEGYLPDRDLILALTADEEGGEHNGVQWLIENRRELIDSAFCINVDSGGGELRAGRLWALDVQAAEKVYASFTLTARNPGGHSSLPVKDNAIYRLAAALGRLSAHEFPARTNEVTRAYLVGLAALASGAESADLRAAARQPPDAAAVARLSAGSVFTNAVLRTTCVATLLKAGHAENALPQTAQATVNCRMLPDEDPAAVRAALVAAIADEQIAVEPIGTPLSGPASPLTPDVLAAIRAAAGRVWGETRVLPMMETGATDGLRLRNAGIPVYGVTGIAYDPEDVRAHGKDERILVRSYLEGLEFAYHLIRALSGDAGPRG
jgi:acetylornithine deacetylase/succinyl-diaminopimelate desuccinylase-like protein